MRVRMTPHLDDVKQGESGIWTIVRKYFQHLPDYGIELVGKKDDNFDILAVHAGSTDRYPESARTVAHLHGCYWTSDYPALSWEWAANASVIESMRRASIITVPSAWVAESVQRDLRVDPVVVPHGVDWQEWQHDYSNDDYILAYSKNRVMDVCNPAYITELARRFPDRLMLCTFAPKDAPANVRVTGLLHRDQMKQVIQRAAIVISSVKETFGLLTLESLAAGTPVLGYAYGGNLDLVQHGANGYLAQPGNFDDLAEGLNYCLNNRQVLGENARQLAKAFTWDAACRKLVAVYQDALKPQPEGVSVVIPTYKYADRVGRAIQSVLEQTRMVKEVIVVDDGSGDNGATETVVASFSDNIVPVRYLWQNNAGVAVARNTGISYATGKYIVCLDADDAIAPQFVQACQEAMDADPLLGIAYTGLLAVEPDGRQSVSPWPPQYNFDNMVYPGGINQIPTCCMFRKVMWERLGGYRARYCPRGAGSEDAEFWLRAGLHGYSGHKVTDAPLFIYSYRSGRVSGDSEYKEINWRELHPSTIDNQHPFPCVATPTNNRPSHPVRQYDEPDISVIVPVGPGHKSHVGNALDSLESQTVRRWEVILVDDTGDDEDWTFDGVPNILAAYPYARVIKTSGKKGAGYARNRGVEASRAPLITFLDADDNFLVPKALEKMIAGWNETGMAVYTDYVSKSCIDEAEAVKLQDNGRLLDYNRDSGLAMHLSHAADYDCDRAVIQPANPLYIWNLITTLIPREWHDEIGGFDEIMPSWEDWEYWLRMARSGKCFARLAEPMVAYRFYTGGRRETGIQMPGELLSYISDKLEGVAAMPCSSCGKKSRRVSIPVVQKAAAAPLTKEKAIMSDDDMVLCIYNNPNRGQHRVVYSNPKIDYGYRAGGGTEKFYVHKQHIAAYPGWFVPYQQPVIQSTRPVIATPPPQPVPVQVEAAAQEPVKLPELDFVDTKPASQSAGPGQVPVGVFRPADLQSIPGVTNKIADALHAAGVKTWQDVVEYGMERLLKIEGVGKKRAEAILTKAQQLANK